MPFLTKADFGPWIYKELKKKSDIPPLYKYIKLLIFIALLASLVGQSLSLDAQVTGELGKQVGYLTLTNCEWVDPCMYVQVQ